MSRGKDRSWRVPKGFEQAFVELQTVPNVGKACSEDLVRLGVKSVKYLKRCDALRMYRRLCRMDKVRHDRCVLDSFMAAVDYAKNGTSKPWWKYTPERKALLAGLEKHQAARVVRKAGARSTGAQDAARNRKRPKKKVAQPLKFGTWPGRLKRWNVP